MTEEEARKEGVKVEKGLFPWAASGRAIANGRDEGFTKLLFDEQTRRIVGGGIVGTHAGDLISEIALAIEMGADRSEEHTSELQSLMHISYAVFCLKKKKHNH